MCQSLTPKRGEIDKMSMDSWLSIMFVAGLMLGGIGGICVACTLVGRNMRRIKHEKIENVVYNKKII